MKYTWLLFDLDNTLLDFHAGSKKAFEEVFLHKSWTYTDAIYQIYEEINESLWGAYEKGEITVPALKQARFQKLMEHIDVQDDPNAISELYLGLLSQQAIWVEGAQELLDQLYGRIKMAIITNGFSQVQRPRIQKVGLDAYVDHMAISSELGVAKPQAGIFEHLFEKMGQPPKEQVLVIGDTLRSDILGGINYGIDTCWYNPKGKADKEGLAVTYDIQHLSALPALLQ